MSAPSTWRAKAGAPFRTEKQPVSGSRGVVAANHPLGAAAGLQMLALGGNAVDAAVAALFALNVVEPQMVGIFGAGWINICLAGGMNGIVYHPETGLITGAACWRADGAPAALSGGPARPGVRFRPTVTRSSRET